MPPMSDPTRIRIIKHEAVPLCGSYEVRFPDGRPSQYFHFDDLSGRRRRSDTADRAMQAAQKLAQAEQELLDAQRLGLVMENAHPLIPKLSSAAARLKHDQDAWKLFARRIQRHPFVKAHIIRRDYENGCPWCDRPFTSTENLQVHHVDYDHACTFLRSVTLDQPTSKRPSRSYTGPDCQSCGQCCPDQFEACMSRLRLVHPFCNARIAKAENELRGTGEPSPACDD
jgi:hypothetical protein